MAKSLIAGSLHYSLHTLPPPLHCSLQLRQQLLEILGIVQDLFGRLAQPVHLLGLEME